MKEIGGELIEFDLIQINEVRKVIGPIADKVPVLCTDVSISRYLRARNWNTKKASKMLLESLKWRLNYKPEKILWEHVAQEAETGKVYRANYCDKFGRPVLIMRPGFQCQNSSSTEMQIKYLVYCMENAIMNLKPDKEQMVWLIDFQRWTMSSISAKVTRETANVLQNHYPERLALAILYNPPKVFESFWVMVKPFLEPKTHKKVRFVYSNDTQSQKVMEALFDMDKLDTAFGGRNTVGFDYEAYGQRMRDDDDKKKSDSINSECSSPIIQSLGVCQSSQSDSTGADQCSDASDEGESTDDTACNSDNANEKIAGPLRREDVPKSEEVDSACNSDNVSEKIPGPLHCEDVPKSEDVDSACNSDNVNEKIPGPLCCEDVPKSEAPTAKKEVQ